MRNKKTMLGFIMLLLIAAVPGFSMKAWSDEAVQSTQDWKRAAELFSFYYRELNSEYSFSGHEKEYIEAWKKWRDDVITFRTEFRKKYGNTAEEAAAGFENVTPPEGVGNSIRQICEVLLPFDFSAKEKEIAGWAVKAGDSSYAKWQNFNPPNATKMELKVDYARRALSSYGIAGMVDPEGEYGELTKKAKDAIAESEKVWKKALAELKWPGHNAAFKGPGGPDTLAEEALKLLQSVDSWSKPEYDDEHFPVAACVTGSAWEVSKTNPITRKPTQFSLNFLVAFAGNKDHDIAYAYNMVFYTKEEEGVKKETPFRYVNSRQYAKYKMLMSNVPKMIKVKRTGGACAAEGRCPGSGLFGVFLRLALALALIAAGLVYAQKTIEKRFSQLSGVYSFLGTRRQVLGWAVLLVGVVCFLRATLFYFAPLSDFLPQLVAVLGGLILLGDSLPAAIFDKIKSFVQLLSPRSEQVGIAAVVLGLLHLLLGGVFLL